MKPFAALAALVFALAGTSLPAFARTSYVVDNAHLLSQSTIAEINTEVADFNAQVHKEVFVDTELSVDGTPQAAAERIFAQQQINGVLIFVVKSPKTIGVVPDSAARSYFPSGSTSAIRDAIRNAFNAGNYDAGIKSGVDLTLSQYRSHLGSLRTRAYAPSGGFVRHNSGGLNNMSFIWWLIVLAVIFFVIRGIFRALAGPRMYPPGYGGGPGPGPGYGGGPGYGYGGGMGGGGFWSGMLGGLGGAFLGNELFGRGGGFMGGGNEAGFGGGEYNQGGGDASGFQNDPGQADMGNASFGGFGDSGGGWGGGGDSGGWGGGGGGDFGGGGDSGGGW
jgi:uncharacterized membrane protein YgcG